MSDPLDPQTAAGYEAPPDRNETSPNMCPDCDGSGRQGDRACRMCGGTGRIEDAVGGG
jgi:DnaJ-class molecular chaperone